jgi:CubicO group peptidase (beta-lactamase class C family)
MKRKHFLMATFGVALSCLAAAGAARADATDDLIKAEMERAKVPGVAVAVIRDGKPVKVQGYGYANLEHKILVTPDTVFQLGSVGKQFTAALVLLLARDSKLSLDDPIGKHLPFAAPEAWQAITVRNLLNHTSGIHDYTEFLDFARGGDPKAEETAKSLTGKPLDFAPGTKWAYSNSNYLLLGVLIEKVSGKFYGDLLTERIFKPLGMTTARINSDAALIPNRAAGYEPTPDGPRNQSYVPPNVNTYADGSVVMSLRDMVKWDAALNTDVPLPKDVRDQMWTPATLKDGKKTEYGCGWMVRAVNGRQVIEHGGAWQGFTANISRYVDDKLTVIVLTNSAGGNPGRITRAVAGSVVPALKPAPVATTPAPGVEQDPKVIGLVREVIKETGEDKLNLDRFTREMRDALAEMPKGQLSQVVRALGPIKTVTILEKSALGADTNYRIRVEFNRQKAIVLLSLAPDGKISGLLMQPE